MLHCLSCTCHLDPEKAGTVDQQKPLRTATETGGDLTRRCPNTSRRRFDNHPHISFFVARVPKPRVNLRLEVAVLQG